MVISRKDVKFIVEPEKCCACKNCVRTCQEDVWRWDKDMKCAVPRYPDECVKCYQCEVVCLGHAFEIVPVEVMASDPLKNKRL